MKSLIALLFLPLTLFVFCYFDLSPSLPMGNATRASFVMENSLEGYDYIQNGEQFIIDVYSDIESFYAIRSQDIIGFNLYFQTLDINDFANSVNGQIFKRQSVEGIEIYEGYTNCYKDFRYVGGQKINIQIAVKEKEVIVGFPLILTGF